LTEEVAKAKEAAATLEQSLLKKLSQSEAEKSYIEHALK
jgi:hypothetical protein